MKYSSISNLRLDYPDMYLRHHHVVVELRPSIEASL